MKHSAGQRDPYSLLTWRGMCLDEVAAVAPPEWDSTALATSLMTKSRTNKWHRPSLQRGEKRGSELAFFPPDAGRRVWGSYMMASNWAHVVIFWNPAQDAGVELPIALSRCARLFPHGAHSGRKRGVLSSHQAPKVTVEGCDCLGCETTRGLNLYWWGGKLIVGSSPSPLILLPPPAHHGPNLLTFKEGEIKVAPTGTRLNYKYIHQEILRFSPNPIWTIENRRNYLKERVEAFRQNHPELLEAEPTLVVSGEKWTRRNPGEKLRLSQTSPHLRKKD